MHSTNNLSMNTPCSFVEILCVSKFAIKVHDGELHCEECGEFYPDRHNFAVIACCGEAKRFCFYCVWKSIPCQECKAQKRGGNIIKNKLHVKDVLRIKKERTLSLSRKLKQNKKRQIES